MSNYPTRLDTDAELPRVSDDITEIGGLAINSLRSAVFAIEKALGLRPQGTATDLSSRLSTSLDSNGFIKASALSGIGLVTLPITNEQVGNNAGIEELKLDLDYGTALLKSWIDSLKARVDILEQAVALDIAHLNQHIAHPSTFGRHTTGDIDAYGTFLGQTAQGVLTNFNTRLNNHIIAPVAAHSGSAISLDASRFSSISASNVQTAAEQLEDIQLTEITRHRDRQHGNGILGTQDSFAAGTRHGITIIAPALTISSTAGDTFIKFAVAPAGAAFQSIVRNDRIDIFFGSRVYTFSIESTQGTTQINIFGQIPFNGTSNAAVYRNAEETTEPSVAMVCMRKDDITTRPSTLQVIHPTSPFVLSSGFRGSSLSSTKRNIRLIYNGGDTGSLDVYAAMLAFSSTPSTWTVENVAKVINASLFSPGISGTNRPLIAFTYKGELGFACDSNDDSDFISIGAVLSNDATSVLGFTVDTVSYAVADRKLYIDGYETSSIGLQLDATGTIIGADTISFPSLNLEAMGIVPGSLARISPFEVGTYVVFDVTPTTLVFDNINEHSFGFSIGSAVRVRIYADSFSLLSAPSQRTLYETFLDGYHDGYGPVSLFKTSVRATYANTAGGGSNLESVLDLTAVSRTFGAESKRMFFDFSQRTVVLGDRVVGPSISNLGLPVSIPASSEEGFRFTLYDANGVDFCEFEAANSLPVTDGYMDITIYPRVSEERFLQVATVLHDKTRFKYLYDTRQFGNIGRQDVRDDFTRDFISYPTSLLRGNGVIYGFTTSGLSSSILGVLGGQVLVNGQLKSIGKSTFAIPADGAATYNLFVNKDGILQLLEDNFFSSSVLSTPSLAELLVSKTETALAQIVVNGSNIITSITDVRRFVNDIDSKLDILVEENDITHGSFASLSAAITYLTALSTSPISKTIKIRGEVFLSEALTLPSNTMLIGDGIGAKITFTSSGASISTSDNNIIRDLLFYRDGTLTNSFIFNTIASNYITIEGCTFEFEGHFDSIIYSELNNSTIRNNVFTNSRIAIQAGASSFNNFNDNLIFNLSDNGIVTSSSYSDIISGNKFSTNIITLSSSSTFISSGNTQHTKILNNILLYNGTQPAVASSAMINLNTALSTLVEGNLLQNGSSGKGFASGFLCSSVTEVDLCDNIFHYFSDNTLGGGITFASGSQIIVEGNQFLQCRNSINIVGTQCMVSNNIINTGTGYALDTSSLGIIIDGNTFITDGSGTGCGVALDDAIINGNHFEFTSSSTSSLLSCGTANNSIITDNKLISPAMTGTAPIYIEGNGNLVSHNAFSITSPPAVMIDDEGSNNVDILNKGQTYNVWISAERAVILPDWTKDLNNTTFFSQIHATTMSTLDRFANMDFTSEDVPAGAKINGIQVWYVNAGSTGDINFTLYSMDISTFTSTSISNTINALNSITPVPSSSITPTVTHYMPKAPFFDTVLIAGADPSSLAKFVFGMTINYTL